ncbi:hypothetical protein E1N52_22035 [Paraburkholderia guartelaensis]|jgi:hypothetical protein|uniref:Uncharacterized protein n=1 Tax=Paraburkholderia guartelaensis TaxID=2546446 RepID=A0A4R5LAQ6_9BURK|nr:hypothetical protein [Paraburkholderia guartelaensis]TDG06240.1 hypothetical protein E1N52_22035 [Paraburkholderia guartelaensis]
MTDKKETLDAQTRQLAAMAYGEASPDNDSDEMFGLASVLVRQRDARGYSDIGTFASSERSFSFVVSDGNLRYTKLMKATDAQIDKDKGMKIAIAAARNALAYGVDKSNGAYFWDGADIKSHYSTHPKVAVGIKFIDPSHNIYNIKESTKLVIKYKFIKKKAAGKITIEKTELYRYDHVYESTAAHGGTIFWKFNPDYVKFTRSKEYL